MGFTQGDFPPVDAETFNDKPVFERMRIVSTFWVENGFGTPKMIHVVYIVKLIVLYIIGGFTVATLTSDLPAFWNVGDWLYEPIVYQKLIVWTVLLETLGVCGSWGPLAGHFKPMSAGFRHYARVGTIKMPPWPDKVPFTNGFERTPADVILYAALVASLIVAMLLPSVEDGQLDLWLGPDNAGLMAPAGLAASALLLVVMGLRCKIVFLAARSEQYLPALLFGTVFGFVDLIIALKLLIVVVWMGAGVSKYGHHFSKVVSPMLANTPWTPKAFRRSLVKGYPNDLQPSGVTHAFAHVGGTLVELGLPLVLLFSTNRTLTLLAVIGMVIFHMFIISAFPLAVPLEWNILFAYAAVVLFRGHPAGDGFGIGDMSTSWLPIVLVAGLAFFPVLGNLRPELVSFLPSMRQYAGNWASAMWAFAPGAEAKLDNCVRAAKNTVDQVEEFGYSPAEADVMMQIPSLGWRMMHSQGPALFSMLWKHLGDEKINTYTFREAEFSFNTISAFNFGDAHMHNEDFIATVQKRCSFEPGEWMIAWVESQPIHKRTQDYMIIDAAVGVIERGTYITAESAAQQPWLPDGPITLNETWSALRHRATDGPGSDGSATNGTATRPAVEEPAPDGPATKGMADSA